MKKEEFEELTPDLNQLIQEARELGFVDDFSSYQSSREQAIHTLGEAIKFLQRKFGSAEAKLNRNMSKVIK